MLCSMYGKTGKPFRSRLGLGDLSWKQEEYNIGGTPRGSATAYWSSQVASAGLRLSHRRVSIITRIIMVLSPLETFILLQVIFQQFSRICTTIKRSRIIFQLILRIFRSIIDTMKFSYQILGCDIESFFHSLRGKQTKIEKNLKVKYLWISKIFFYSTVFHSFNVFHFQSN